MDHFIPDQQSLCDLVKFFLHRGCEIIVEDILKILNQESVDQVTMSVGNSLDFSKPVFSVFSSSVIFARSAGSGNRIGRSRRDLP